MSEQFSADRSDAIRAALEMTVHRTHPGRFVTPARAWATGAALVVGGLIAGTGISAAALTGVPSFDPFEDQQGLVVPAPPGIVPGEPIISLLGSTVSQPTTGDADIPLVSRPDGATHLRVAVACLTPGRTSWGVDPTVSGVLFECGQSDLNDSAYTDFELTPDVDHILIRAPEGVSSIVTYQYLNYVRTALGVNARGESYGSGASQFPPDLVAATGTAPGGDQVDGYVRSAELNSFGPDWPGQPSTPEEALLWQAEREERYPTGWDIPLLKDDGVTQIGTFRVSN